MTKFAYYQFSLIREIEIFMLILRFRLCELAPKSFRSFFQQIKITQN